MLTNYSQIKNGSQPHDDHSFEPFAGPCSLEAAISTKCQDTIRRFSLQSQALLLSSIRGSWSACDPCMPSEFHLRLWRCSRTGCHSTDGCTSPTHRPHEHTVLLTSHWSYFAVIFTVRAIVAVTVTMLSRLGLAAVDTPSKSRSTIAVVLSCACAQDLRHRGAHARTLNSVHAPRLRV